MQRIVLALAAVAALAACSSADSPPPAGPLDERRLEHLAEACGSVNTGPRGDVSFRATAAPAEPVEEAMTARVKIDVNLDSAHGKHSAGLKWVHGYVTDDKNTVVGLVTGIGATEGASGSGVVELTLAACPVEGLPKDPLGDGAYGLALYGAVSPTDHDHAQQEYWVAAPLAVTVTGGHLSLG